MQEAVIKMPSCAADRAQSTQHRYYKYISAVVFHRVPPSPAKNPQMYSYSIFRHYCNLIRAHKKKKIFLTSTFAWFHCNAKEPGLVVFFTPSAIFYVCGTYYVLTC